MTEENGQIINGGFYPAETTEYRERGRCSVFVIENPPAAGKGTGKEAGAAA